MVVISVNLFYCVFYFYNFLQLSTFATKAVKEMTTILYEMCQSFLTTLIKTHWQLWLGGSVGGSIVLCTNMLWVRSQVRHVWGATDNVPLTLLFLSLSIFPSPSPLSPSLSLPLSLSPPPSPPSFLFKFNKYVLGWERVNINGKYFELPPWL